MSSVQCFCIQIPYCTLQYERFSQRLGNLKNPETFMKKDELFILSISVVSISKYVCETEWIKTIEVVQGMFWIKSFIEERDKTV